jgi:hypothetical protein
VNVNMPAKPDATVQPPVLPAPDEKRRSGV